MGGIFSGCSECCKDPPNRYESLNEEGEFHNAPETLDHSREAEFDQNASIFTGLSLDQKFTSKNTYETRFVWVNLATRTIHMSQYDVKERRHKEASLADVTDVVAGPPQKQRRTSDGNGGLDDGKRCLSVHFKRGGGIDLRFASNKERDVWFDILTRIIKLQKREDEISSPRGK